MYVLRLCQLRDTDDVILIAITNSQQKRNIKIMVLFYSRFFAAET